MGINRYIGETFGSLIKIEYAAIQNILSFVPSGRGQINAAGIIFKTGTGWVSIYCSEDTMGHEQLQVNDDNGQSFTQTVVGFTPGDQPAIESGLLDIGESQYLLRITRPDGLIKIVGTQLEPLYLVQHSNTQTTVPGAAGTTFTWSGSTLKRALIYAA